jgi:hypothetical protein
MKSWTRPLDWTNLVLGGYLLFVPLFTKDSENAASVWVAELFGIAIVSIALWALAQPGSAAAEWTQATAGALLVLSPFVFGYTDLTGAAWNDYIVGAAVALLALSALPAANRGEHSHASRTHERIDEQ